MLNEQTLNRLFSTVCICNEKHAYNIGDTCHRQSCSSVYSNHRHCQSKGCLPERRSWQTRRLPHAYQVEQHHYLQNDWQAVQHYQRSMQRFTVFLDLPNRLPALQLSLLIHSCKDSRVGPVHAECTAQHAVYCSDTMAAR